MTYSVINPTSMVNGQLEDISVVLANFESIESEMGALQGSFDNLEAEVKLYQGTPFVDNGSPFDFIVPNGAPDSGLYVVEVRSSGIPSAYIDNVHGSALVNFSKYDTNKWHVGILAQDSEPNSGVSITVAFTTINNNSATAKLRITTQGASGKDMTAFFRRMIRDL